VGLEGPEALVAASVNMLLADRHEHFGLDARDHFWLLNDRLAIGGGDLAFLVARTGLFDLLEETSEGLADVFPKWLAVTEVAVAKVAEVSEIAVVPAVALVLFEAQDVCLQVQPNQLELIALKVVMLGQSMVSQLVAEDFFVNDIAFLFIGEVLFEGDLRELIPVFIIQLAVLDNGSCIFCKLLAQIHLFLCHSEKAFFPSNRLQSP